MAICVSIYEPAMSVVAQWMFQNPPDPGHDLPRTSSVDLKELVHRARWTCSANPDDCNFCMAQELKYNLKRARLARTDPLTPDEKAVVKGAEDSLGLQLDAIRLARERKRDEYLRQEYGASFKTYKDACFRLKVLEAKRVHLCKMLALNDREQRGVLQQSIKLQPVGGSVSPDGTTGSNKKARV